MPSSTVGSLSPSILRSISRFRRLVILSVVVCAVIALIYTAITGSAYTAEAQLVIQQPPTFLHPLPVSGSHSTAASYVDQQVAILQSPAVTYGAAAIVNSKIAGAHVSGDQIHSGLTVKPQTGAAAGISNTTQVAVTMPTSELAAASANAVVASYISVLHGQFKQQANQSIAALDKEIASVKSQLNSVAAPSTGKSNTEGSGSSTTNTTTITTTPASNTSSGSSSTANERVPLLATLTNLTSSRSQVMVDEQTDLAYRPAILPATIPSATSNGSFLRNIVIGILIGLLIGVIAAYGIAVRRRQFEHAPEPELMYGVPLIAAVPFFMQNASLPTGLPILTEAAEEPAEQMRVIATTLRSIRNSHSSLVVAFSSANPRSGTTAMVANAGLALAKMEERVLVIDGDPINRGLTVTLTDTGREEPLLTPRAGFSEVVGGRPLMDSITPADANSRLSVLTAGTDPNLAMHRWSLRSIRLALRDATEHFDMVLIDVPPIGSSSYGMDLADAAENLVMVIPYLDLIQVHERLRERMLVADLKLLGYVFNGDPSRNHFSPYYPILYDSRSELASVGAAPERVLPIAHFSDRATAVQPDDPITDQHRPVDDLTQQLPTVDPQ